MTPTKSRGIHRMSADLDMDIWDGIIEAANAAGVKPIHLLRTWLAERVAAERAAKKTKRAG